MLNVTPEKVSDVMLRMECLKIAAQTQDANDWRGNILPRAEEMYDWIKTGKREVNAVSQD